MKRNVITLAALVAIISGGFVIAQGPPKGGGAPANARTNTGPGAAPIAPQGPRGEYMLGKLAERLNLTPEQKAKVQPVIDQARPQFQQIREEAVQKMRSVMEGTMAQIRPVLTPEQQGKLDEMQRAHENMRNAMHQMHDAEGN
jgi:Spy/CpxP family protein refolding chaperone